MNQVSFNSVSNELRSIMKSKRITFSVLSLKTGIPISTLKKNLTGKDCSYERINKICHGLGVNLSIVLDSLESKDIAIVNFTPEQSEEFEVDRDLFYFYWLLVYERRPLNLATKLIGLSDQKQKKYLLKLDKLSLIKYLSDQKLKIPKIRPVIWSFDDPFSNKIKLEWSQSLLKDSVQADKYQLSFFQLSEKVATEFKEKLAALENEYAIKTSIELSLRPEKLNQIKFLYCLGDGSFVKTKKELP